VVGYASRKNDSSFLQHVDDSMFALITKESGSLLLEDTSDDNGEIFGATSEEGMLMMHDDGISIDSSSDDVVVVDFDPFGGIAALQGYTFIGKLAFICFGPVSKYFASTLAMGGQSKRSAEEKKEGSMRSIQKINKAQNDINRKIGMDRGMSMQAQMQCAFMAQNKDDAIQQHRDMRMVMLTKQIKSTERLIELKIKMSDRMGGGGSEAIETLMDKLDNLSANLVSMMSEVRVTNPIVGNVLANATKAMGLESDVQVRGMPKHDEDYEDDGDSDKDLLMDG
jgi:hypothetical protein